MKQKQIFALAAFTYLFLIPFTFHPDLKIIFYQSQFFTKGILNIYSFFSQNANLVSTGPFVYPPLAYYIFGILFIPVKIIGGYGFTQWLGMGNDAVNVSHLFQYLFALKLPVVLIQIFSGYLLAKLFDSEEEKRKALILWFFNPISIYTVAFMGQIDGFASLLTILALYFASKKPGVAMIFLGLGGAFKTYPLLLIPYLAFIIGKTWWSRIKYLIIGTLPYILLIAPFITTSEFYSSTFASGLSKRIFELKLSIGFGENLLIIPAVLSVLVLLALTKKYGSVRNLIFFFFAVTFIIVAGSHFHPQWALWFLPFLISGIVKGNRLIRHDILLALLIFFIGWIGTIFLFDDKFLTWGIISPLDPGVLILPSPAEFLRKFADPLLIQSLFHTLMMASGLWLVGKSIYYEKS